MGSKLFWTGIAVIIGGGIVICAEIISNSQSKSLTYIGLGMIFIGAVIAIIGKNTPD